MYTRRDRAFYEERVTADQKYFMWSQSHSQDTDAKKCNKNVIEIPTRLLVSLDSWAWGWRKVINK